MHTVDAAFFTPWRAVQAEGARIGFVTCRICGATILLDPDALENVALVHLDWHYIRGDQIVTIRG